MFLLICSFAIISIVLYYFQISLSTSPISKNFVRTAYFQGLDPSTMDVLKTAITVFVILFPVLMKAQQNLQGKASIFITLRLKKP